MQRILKSNSFLVKPASHISTYFSGIIRNEAFHTDEFFSLLVINAFEVIKLTFFFWKFLLNVSYTVQLFFIRLCWI